MRMLGNWLGSRPVRGVGAVSLAAAAAVALIIATTAASADSSTFTFDQGSWNPGLSGTTFQARALECDRAANVQATGKMKFVDTTTGVTIGTATMVPNKQFVNCGQATITDKENLSPGSYTIQATYIPGGTTPVPASGPATYVETVDP
jgi:hypothetical protein